ncbi:FadR family transcriptional regulator [Corticibacter populi]|uniref:FadR family transcriptional regulator n=1 Tax=Corticibacter populi TaxID=1550736 RepID=A0A3M6R114_9BURK|nr:FadR/GntR family transcriptional regulator [Corticibacter populi]RMX08422.1 FadR family transcriptional regulator [Corticibacter populi]RZS35728.1 GntR family transcriptional regulator [Corticibacter populi]
MTRLANTAAFTLQQRIFSGEYPAGSLLPSQRQLAEELEISRASLREALSMLETLGLMQVLPGKGMRVRGAGQSMSQPLKAFTLPGQTLNLSPAQLIELRLVVEPAWAALAARHCTAAAHAELEDVQSAFVAALAQHDLQTAARMDLRFHRLLSQQSGNPALQGLFAQLDAAIHYSLQLPFTQLELQQAPADEHAAIVQAIVARDEMAAASLMRDHLLSAARRSRLDRPAGVEDTPWLCTSGA